MNKTLKTKEATSVVSLSIWVQLNKKDKITETMIGTTNIQCTCFTLQIQVAAHKVKYDQRDNTTYQLSNHSSYEETHSLISK